MSTSDTLEPDSVADKLAKEDNKPETVNIDSGSPTTPLQTQPDGLIPAATTTSSSSCSSSSSGSVTIGAEQTMRRRKVGFILPNPADAHPLKATAPSDAQSESADQSSTPSAAPLKSIMRSSSASKSDPAADQSLKSSTPSTDQPKPNIPSGSSAAQPKSSNPAGGITAASSGSRKTAGNLRLGRGSATSNTTTAKRSGKSSVAPMKPPKIVPAGTLFPDGIVKITGMNQVDERSKCIGPGMKSYGYGSVIGGMDPPGERSESVKIEVDALLKTALSSSDAEEVSGIGKQMYFRNCLNEALKCFDRAVELLPTDAAYHSIRATVLLRLGRIGEAVIGWEEALKLDPKYSKAHFSLASVHLRLGQVDNAGTHFYAMEEAPEPKYAKLLQLVDKHLKNCIDARRSREWKIVLTEAAAAIAAGADLSPQLAMCKVEALMKLQRLDDARKVIAYVYKVIPFPESFSEIRFFDMLCRAYTSFVRSQMFLAIGRFENAVTAAEKASDIDPGSSEIATWYKNVKLITRARDHGKELYDSGRYTEARVAYTDALRLDPSNAALIFHRAESLFKIGNWESSIADYNQALLLLPSMALARFQRAASYSKLERWAEAVSDYEILRKERPYDKEIAELLFHAQVSLKKSNGEVVLNMEFGGEVEEISRLAELKVALTRPGVSIVLFFKVNDYQCKQMCDFMSRLCIGYPFMNFLKVDIEKCPEVGDAEKVRVVPAFKIYKIGTSIKEIVCPSKEALEKAVKHYNL